MKSNVGGQPGHYARHGFWIKPGVGRIVAWYSFGLRQLSSRLRLKFEHMIRVLWELEGYIFMSRRCPLKRLAVGLPVHLEILFPDDNQRWDIHLAEQ
jgi:hypothetical protein